MWMGNAAVRLGEGGRGTADTISREKGENSTLHTTAHHHENMVSNVDNSI